jgi:hypothetical protein
MENTKFVLFHGKVLELSRAEDGLWRDSFGTVWALADDSASVDPINRCGVGMLSLPEGWGQCSSHDYAYSSPAYQLYHTREEADRMLEHLNPGIVGHLFYYAAHLFGSRFWEDKATV